ncbi:MAG: nitroreductase family protein [Armatimonadota bacterium]
MESMDTYEAIISRRSVRDFTSEAVPEDMVEMLLRAAMRAPSAGNEQAWQFIVVKDRELLDAVPDFSPYATMCLKAPMAIVVCGDTSLEKFPGFWIQDCCAAIENLLLAAHASGLGAVWTALYPDEGRVEGARALFGIPEHVIPLAIIPVGYPKHQPYPAQTYLPERVHFDRY